jgi:hypothetical protein
VCDNVAVPDSLARESAGRAGQTAGLPNGVKNKVAQVSGDLLRIARARGSRNIIAQMF